MSHRLVVARHGETEWSRCGRHTGRTDVPLTERGRRQAEAIGRVLVGWSFARVLTSPLTRARDTCRLARPGAPAQVVDDLAEWDYGAYEGRSTDDIRAERPGWLLWDDGVPGGESLGGESLGDVSRRADRLVGAVRAVDGDVLAFGHGHMLRVLAARWVGLDAGAARSLALEAGSLSMLGWEREVPVIERWNDDVLAGAGVGAGLDPRTGPGMRDWAARGR